MSFMCDDLDAVLPKSLDGSVVRRSLKTRVKP